MTIKLATMEPFEGTAKPFTRNQFWEKRFFRGHSSSQRFANIIEIYKTHFFPFAVEDEKFTYITQNVEY